MVFASTSQPSTFVSSSLFTPFIYAISYIIVVYSCRLRVWTVWSGNEIHQLSGEASIATTLPRHDGKQLFTIHRSSSRCSCFCVCPLASISHPWVRTKFSTPLNSLHHISLIPCITTFSSHLQLEDCIWYNFTAFHLAYRILSSAVLP